MFRTSGLLAAAVLLIPLFSGPYSWGDGPLDLPMAAHRHRSSVVGQRHHQAGHPHHRPLLRGNSLFFSVGPNHLYSSVFRYGGYYPYYPVYPVYPIPWGAYYYPPFGYGEYYLPATIAPAELNYGPLATQRFFGWNQLPAQPIVRPEIHLHVDAAKPAVREPADDGAAVAPDPAPAPALAPAAAPDPIVEKLRKSNATARARAHRFLEFGDALFRKGDCHEAAQRYRSALKSAPDLSEVYYRQSFALIAVRQYRLAAKALRIAVSLDPEALVTDSLLITLYGGDKRLRETHLEQLADEALANPDDGELLFLLAAVLYGSDEPDRAAKFMQRAYERMEPEPKFLVPLLRAVPADPVID